jgi:hypothetical protein
MDYRKRTELRLLIAEAESTLEDMKRSGADPGDIAECEHHVKLARWHLAEAERMADHQARFMEHTEH